MPRRTGGKDSVIAIYQTFETADLPLTLGLGNDGIWHRFWEAVGEPGGGAGEDVATNAGRRTHREAIVARIQTILRTRPRAEWLDRFTRAKVPAGPIYQVDEVTADPHFAARGTFFRIPRDGHDIPQVALGIHMDGAPSGYFTPPPRLGEHTDSVLRDTLGYDAPAIAALRDGGII